MDEPQDETNKVSTADKSSKAGRVLIVIGAVVAFFPILIAILNTAPGHNWMSEGDPQSGGTAIWLMIFTLPIGGLIGLIGLVKLIQASASQQSAYSGYQSQGGAQKPAKSNLLISVISIFIGAFYGLSGAGWILFWVAMSFNLPNGFDWSALLKLLAGVALIVFGIRKARGK